MIPRIFTGVLIGLAVSAGFYGVAATTATAIAGNYDKIESTRHTRIVEIASNVKSAWAEHRMARAKCERLAREQKNTCRENATAAAMLAMRTSREL